ncbi:MAG: 50S ribosomal protein L17 [Candidatus Brocadiia bacterium]
MKHGKKGRKLNRTPAHRKALRQNLAKALLEHERIVTTPAKAKEAQPFVERLITLARKAQPYKDTGDPDDRGKYLHYYRQALKKLQDKKMVQKLFGEGPWVESESLAERYADRPSGQTRIIRLQGSRLGVPVGQTIGEIPVFTYTINGKTRTLKLTGNRLGDNAEQVIFELVEKEKPSPEEEEVEPEISLSEEEDAKVAAVEEEEPPESNAGEEEEETQPSAETEAESGMETDGETETETPPEDSADEQDGPEEAEEH